MSRDRDEQLKLAASLRHAAKAIEAALEPARPGVFMIQNWPGYDVTVDGAALGMHCTWGEAGRIATAICDRRERADEKGFGRPRPDVDQRPDGMKFVPATIWATIGRYLALRDDVALFENERDADETEYQELARVQLQKLEDELREAAL